MTLPPGSRLGRYEVVAHIGSGGMGEVYRARDLHLDRAVALKTIAPAYAPDPSAQPRFERERRLMATLEHPHICRLLDAGREAGVDFLAMELLEGESLAARLRRGPLPVPAAIGCAIEIADALAYAHRHAIVHRDLKPANVFLTPTGARVLDFGLAKLRPAVSAPGASAAAQGDTVPLDGTRAGTLLGSASYMAPERLEGQDADPRTDIFGFGLILYEMLTGRPAFAARSAAALIAAILSSDPPPLGLAHPKAPDLEWIVRRCLEKDPDRRWQSMGDVQAVLRRLASHDPEGGLPAQSGARRLYLVLVAAALLLAGSAAGLGWLLAGRQAAPPTSAPLAFTINPPIGGAFTPTEGSLRTAQLALSPDGGSLAFVAAGPDRIPRLWVRRFSAVLPQPLPGTEDATFPFWSPDGRHLGFFSRGFLRTIDLEGGPPRQLAPAGNGRGGSWNETGGILFAPDTTGPLRLVDTAGGNARDATVLDAARGENSHRWPTFLPDGRRFLFFVHSPTRQEQHDGIYLASVNGGAAKLLVRSDAGGVLQPPDRLLFVENGTLLAMRFDADSVAPVERPSAMADGVGVSSNLYAAVSVSGAGTIAYASTAMISDLVWFDRRGQTETLAAIGQHVDFRLSPDGTAVAIAEVDRDANRADIFVMNLSRPGPKRRITDEPATDASPVWSPDGRRLVFRSNRELVHDLYLTPALSGPQQLFFRSADAKYPTSWSGAAELIAFHADHDISKWDVHVVSTRTGGAAPILDSKFDEVQGQFSPDGRWLAYTSNETREFEVYVREWPSGTTEPVSVNGGSDPRWRSDGRELFYITPAGRLMAVGLDYRAGRLQSSQPKALFEVGEAEVTPPYTSIYDVSADGQRFLVRVPRQDVATTPLTVVTRPR